MIPKSECNVVQWDPYDNTRQDLQKKKVDLKMPTFDQMVAYDFPKRHHIMNPWLREAESAMVYAKTGLGKSFVALGIAIAVAGQGSFLGWKPDDVPEGIKVLYVDGEMHGEDIAMRCRMLCQATPSVNNELLGCNLHFLSRQMQDEDFRFPSITDESGIDFYLKTLKERDFDLVIYDNFTTLGEVEDENDASSFNALQDFLLKHKAAGIATLLVHHSGKNEASYRGSSKLAATFEVIMRLAPLETHLDTHGASFKIEWEKVRAGGRGLSSLSVRLITPDESNPFDENPPMWKFDANLTRLEKIREKLKKGEYAYQKEIAEEFGVTPQMISKDMDRAIENGLWTNKELKTWLRYGKSKAAKIAKYNAEVEIEEDRNSDF